MATVVVDEDWVYEVRDRIMRVLLTEDFGSYVPDFELLETFELLADWNGYVYDNWDAEGMDLNLNGAQPDESMIPIGVLYPLSFGSPDDCLLEDVGADIM